MRIAVAAVLLLSPELRRAQLIAGDPHLLEVVPEGLHTLSRISFGPRFVHALELCAISSGATALLGFWLRASMALLTASAGVIFSFSQRSGAVIHDMHLFWFGALLSVSRCGDAWALDAWGKPVALPSLDYGVPASFARALLGLVYFFPGVHKLFAPKPGFTHAATLIHQMQPRRAFRRAGIVVLENQVWLAPRPAAPFYVVGLADSLTRPQAIEAAIAQVSKGAPFLVLVHEPDVFPELDARAALVLAGHTHGGQVRLPFVGRPIVPSQYGQRYAAGHVVEGGRHLFVTTGVGTSIYPVRLGCTAGDRDANS